MAKIGFVNYGDNNEKKTEKKKEPSMLQQLIEQRFSPEGDKEQLLLLTTDDIRRFLWHIVPVDVKEINMVLTVLGYHTMLVGNAGVCSARIKTAYHIDFSISFVPIYIFYPRGVPLVKVARLFYVPRYLLFVAYFCRVINAILLICCLKSFCIHTDMIALEL